MTSISSFPVFIWEYFRLVSHTNIRIEAGVNVGAYRKLSRGSISATISDLTVVHLDIRVETRAAHLNALVQLQGTCITSGTSLQSKS